MKFIIEDKDYKDAYSHECKRKVLFFNEAKRALSFHFSSAFGIGINIKASCSCGWKKNYTNVSTW